MAASIFNHFREKKFDRVLNTPLGKRKKIPVVSENLKKDIVYKTKKHSLGDVL